MNTIVDLRSFKPSHASGLTFSMFEGLRDGESFRVILDEDPDKLRTQFSEAGIGNFLLEIQQHDNTTWEIEIIKISEEHRDGSCCGMCGG